MTAKFNATGHSWITSLTNYNFPLNFKSGITNRDIDTLSRNPLEDHDWHIGIELVQVIISNTTNDTTMVEAYSCNIQVTKTMDTAHNPKTMSFSGLVVAQ